MQEQEAIRQCQAGKQEGLGILFQLHHQAVLRTAYGITRNHDLAEDVTQDVFIELFTAIKRYDPTRPFVPWLYRIAVHKSLDVLRKSGRTTDRHVPIDVDIPASPNPSPEDRVIDRELHAAIWAAVGTLSPKHRAVVVLRFYHDFSVAEMAVALDCRKGTIRSRLHYALRRLREPPEEPGQAPSTPKSPYAPIGPGLANANLPPYGGTAIRMACSFNPVRDEVEPC